MFLQLESIFISNRTVSEKEKQPGKPAAFLHLLQAVILV
jgi:hypothetical protein